MAADEDLSVFFDPDEFADAATFGTGTVNVLFDNAYLRAHEMVSTTDPVCLARAADIDAGDVGSTITISGTAYTIRDVQPQDDGTLVLVQLEKN